MIIARNLSKSISDQAVLDDVSFQIEDNEVIILSGPSGSGKTTLLRIISGLDKPDAGEVLINGKIATSKHHSMAPHRRNIGFAFQSIALWPHMTVAGNIQFVIDNGTCPAPHNQLHEVLKEVGIVDIANRFPNEISYGQARKVALARVLAAQPHYLFLDESFANLDLQSRSSLLGLVLEKNKTKDMAVLLVTHDIDEMKQFGGKHLHLVGGKLTTVTNEDKKSIGSA